MTELVPEYPGSRAGLRPGDTIVKVNDIKLTPESILKVGELLAGEAGTKVRLTVLHSGNDKPEVIELTRERFVKDPATGELLYPLRAAVQERLDKAAARRRTARAAPELAGQWSDAKAQVADYTAAIEVVSEQDPRPMADLARLYVHRANALVALRQWQRAVDDYAKGITGEITDALLLSQRARAYEALNKWEAAAADWSRAATRNQDGAKLLAEFARRLAAGGESSLAKAQFDKSRDIYERLLETDSSSDSVAAELAQVLVDRQALEGVTLWTVLKPIEAKSDLGADLVHTSR